MRGGQFQLMQLARGLGARGHHQLIVSPEESPLEVRAQGEGWETLPIPAEDPARILGIFLVRQRLKQFHPDILHAHGGSGHTLGYFASLGLPVRRVASRRVAFAPPRDVDSRLKYGRGTDGVVAVSRYVATRLESSGVPREKIEVIHDGIDIPPENSNRDARLEARRRFGMGEKDFVVGHIGFFTPEKGQDVLLQAFQIAAPGLPQARLVLAGDGPGRQSIVEAARSMPESVRMPGYVEDANAFFSALDLFAMPSRSEGLGSSALLAMARGLPVVASRTGGLPEIIEDGMTGLLVPPGDPQALSEGLLGCAQDPSRLLKWGAKGRERARWFSSDIMVERTVAFYRRLLTSPADAGQRLNSVFHRSSTRGADSW